MYVTLGSGRVTETKCLACHVKIDKFNDIQYQHDVHVSKNTDFLARKIECEDCHSEIKHGSYGDLFSLPPKKQQISSPAAVSK